MSRRSTRERRPRFENRDPSSRQRRASSRTSGVGDHREHVERPPERSYPQRSPSRRRESFSSYTPIDPYAPYIPPPPYFLPPVLRQSSVYGSRPPPPNPIAVRSPYGDGPGYQNVMPYNPNYYDQLWEMPDGFLRDPPEEEPDGVQVDFSALQSVHNVSEKTAATLMPSVDAVTLVCANVSRVLYLRTDDLQSKAGASTAEIENTAAELSGFAMVLGNLREILQSTSQVISDKAFQNMNALLLYCKKALQKIQSVITTSRKTPSRFNFLKRNSLNSSLSKAKPVRLNLECLKTSLTAMMSTIILAGRQNERHEVHSDNLVATRSLGTLANENDTDRGNPSLKAIYELDAAVERITLKLEDDIFANSRAVKRWQDAERREFDDLYMRNLVPDNASRVSPASQWISTLVPFQPANSHMKRITAPLPAKAISYRGEEVMASGSGSRINEDEEEARVKAVIQVLLAKWTESQPGPIQPGISNRDSTLSNSPNVFENQSGARSDQGETQPLDGDGVLVDGMLEIQHNSDAGSSASKKTKHVSFQDADIEDHHTPYQPNGGMENSKQEGDSERRDGILTEKTSANGVDQTGALTTNDLSNRERMSGKTNDINRAGRDIYDTKERYADDYINSANTKFEDPDDLPKTGWEQADDVRLASRVSNLWDDPSLYGSHRAPFGNLNTLPYYPAKKTPRSSAMLAYEDPYAYGQEMPRPTTYPPANYHPPRPTVRPSALISDEEERSTHRGFAETINSSTADPSSRSQAERYRSSGSYPRRHDSSSNTYSEDEDEPVIPKNKSKDIVLRGNPLSSVLQQLQTELREARDTIEEKNAELRNSTDAERLRRLQRDLYNALDEQKEARAAAERQADADERNSAMKADQIEALEASNATQAEQITDLETSNATQAEQITGLETSNTAQAEQITDLERDNAAQAKQITDLEASLTAADAKATILKAKVTRRDAKIARLERRNHAEEAAPPADEPVEVIEEVELIEDVDVIEEVDVADSRARSRRRTFSSSSRRRRSSSSKFSYYTESERRPKKDKTWELAETMIVLFSLGFGLSAVLAPYIHSNQGDVMLKMLRVMPEPPPKFVLQAQSHV